MPLVVKKSPTFEQLEGLAKKVPAPLSWFIPDPYDPSTLVHPVGAITRQAGLNILRRYIGRGDLSRQARKELIDAIKVMRKLPRKALQQIERLHLEPEHFGKHVDVGGRYEPGGYVFLEPSTRVEGIGTSQAATLSGALAHEVGGHAVLERLLAKMGKGYPRFSFGQPGATEGIAEFLSQKTLQKAGVVEPPLFGYGPAQRAVYEKLMRRQVSNPYSAVRRYLQEILSTYP